MNELVGKIVSLEDISKNDLLVHSWNWIGRKLGDFCNWPKVRCGNQVHLMAMKTGGGGGTDKRDHVK